MNEREALKLALEALEEAADAIDSWGSYASGYFQVKHDLEGDISKAKSAIAAMKEALAQPEQEPVAMKFKIYKPTVPDPMRQGINNALLPWVYDQDRNSGFDATMWVTPVATLPPQRPSRSDIKPLTDEQKVALCKQFPDHLTFNAIHAIEAAHGIKELA